jgi:alpha-tubulin suppressor-like RCC1 family protein
VIQRVWAVLACVSLVVCVSVREGTAASVAAGSAHSAVVNTTNSTAWGWGTNVNGQLGDASTTLRRTPVQVSGLTGVVMVAAGASHTLFLKSDGTVWASGSNANGRLGDGTTTQRTAPVQVTGLTGVVAIAAGDAHSLACKSDGTLWAWGYNANGRLGDGTTTDRWSPVQITSVTGVMKVAAGASHSLALKTDGTAWSFGYNGYRQLGDGTTTDRWSPVPVSGLTGVTDVAGGGSHSLFVKADGTIRAAGYNFYGQLGDGTYVSSGTPVAVSGISNAVAASAGSNHSVALLADGVIRAWGSNMYGQLGTGTGEDSSVPELVYGIPAVAVVASTNHTLAVTVDDVVWAWGRNNASQLGEGTTEHRLAPVSISAPGFVWKVATPTFSVASGTYATTKSVTLSCYTAGATIRYTTDGTDPTVSSPAYSAAIPINVSTVLKARAFKSGLPDSNVGRADYELKVSPVSVSPAGGTYSTTRSVTLSTPTSGATIRYTTDGTDPTASSSVYTGPVTVDASLTLKAAGYKDGWTPSDTTDATYLMKVGTPALTPGGGAYGSAQTVTVSTVTSGATLRYTTDGGEPGETDPVVVSGATLPVSRSQTLRVRGWRAGWTPSDTAVASYVLNLGTTATPTFSPPGGSYGSVVSVTIASATAGATVRYTLDGPDPGPRSPVYVSPILVSGSATLRARTYRAEMTPSAVGTATYAVSSGAVEAPALSLPAGWYRAWQTVVVTCPTAGATIHYTTSGADPTEADPVVASGGAITVDRAVILKARAWKAGLSPSPITRQDYLVTGDVAAGGNHALALKADGTVFAWGYNTTGQIGDGTQTTRWSPVAVPSVTDVVAVAAGARHSLAVKRDGSLWAWGDNSQGQIGDGTTASLRSSPVQVTGISNIVAVAAGDYHSLAVTASGVLWAWGLNSVGQLGDGTTTLRRSPVQVTALPGVAGVAAGQYHSLARTVDLAVWAWGQGGSGQIGDGTYTNRSSPTRVPALTGVTAIAAGSGFSMALKSDGLPWGEVWSWGDNADGQLADGTLTKRNSPNAGRRNTASIGAGAFHSLTVALDGSSGGAGGNAFGALGDGSTTSRTSLVRTTGLPEALMSEGGGSFTLAVRADGALVAFGYNGYGELGIGSSISFQTSPVEVPGMVLAQNGWLEADDDADGLTNGREMTLGTDTLNPDTNGNGIRDGAEFGIGQDAATQDPDGDGLSTASELALGTDPLRPDSDGDGVVDGQDAFPLDATRSQMPAPNPGDQTPPVITLQEPAGAVLVP